MAIEITSNFNVGTRLPIDSRTVVNTLLELQNIKTVFEGLECWVSETQKKYRYCKNNEGVLQWQEIDAFDITKILPYLDNAIPKGMVCLWSGSVADIPKGWHLCDGTEGTIDLRNRFVVGAGLQYSVGATGGVDSVALTTNQMPSHKHSVTLSSNGAHTHNATASTSGLHSHTYQEAQLASTRTGNSSNTKLNNNLSKSTSEAGSHTHSISISEVSSHTHTATVGYVGGNAAHENRPPYYALCYIQKITKGEGEAGEWVTQKDLEISISRCLKESKDYTDSQCSELSEQIANLLTDVQEILENFVKKSDIEGSGFKSNKFGLGTLANAPYQIVLGRYNIPDQEGKYALIVGNGTSNEDRKNAFAVTWDGEIISENVGDLMKNFGGVIGAKEIYDLADATENGILYILTEE